MESIFDYLNFVNEQASFHERKAVEFQGTKRERLHKSTARTFRDLEAVIQSLRNATIFQPVPGANPLALNSADVKDLPPELLEELVNLPDNDKLESDIVDIINSSGGTLLLDHILIALYRRNNEIHQRSQIVSKLYRMNKKGLVFSSPEKKGAYTTVRPANDSGEEIDDQTAQLDLK